MRNKYFTTEAVSEENLQLLIKIAESSGVKVSVDTLNVERYPRAYFDLGKPELGLCMEGSALDIVSEKLDFKEFLLYLTGVKIPKNEVTIVTDKYDVIVNEEGIDFGCQFVEKNDAEKIFKAWREVNE